MSTPRSPAIESEIHAEDVRREHLSEVDARAHGLYLLAVLGGASLLMLGLLILLDAGT